MVGWYRISVYDSMMIWEAEDGRSVLERKWIMKGKGIAKDRKEELEE